MRWTQTDYLLAVIAELVDRGNRWFFQSHTKQGTPAPDPIEIRRPGAPERVAPKRAISSAQEVKSFLGRGVHYTKGS